MSDNSYILHSILKNVAVKYFYIITCVFLFFTVYYWIEDIILYSFLAGISVIFHSIFIFIPYRLGYESIRLLIPVYLFFISIVVYPFVLLHWQMGSTSAFVWFFIIPAATRLFFSIKVNIYWYIYIFLLVCSVFFVSPFLPQKFVVHFNESQIFVVTFFTFISCLSLIFFFLHYSAKINQIKLDILERNVETGMFELDIDQDQTEIEKNSIKDKYNFVYNNILDYFEKEKPYCDPDFTISQLAYNLETNVNYISKAIKINRDMNFNVFINTYRINKIKDMFREDFHNKYTIRYIYRSSGFKHQSTFNKAFKQIEGITPSDYIKKNSK